VFGQGAPHAWLDLVEEAGVERGDLHAVRPRAQEAYGGPVVVTYRPSAVLRADDRAAEVRAALWPTSPGRGS
jgi:hypothetical protein